MNTRKPIYKDLLEHVEPEELKNFIDPIMLGNTTTKVTELDKVDREISDTRLDGTKVFYISALARAVHFSAKKLVAALLRIGANVDINDVSGFVRPSLFIAISKIPPPLTEDKNNILEMMLDANPDLYISNMLLQTAFSSCQHNTGLILRLLEADPELGSMPKNKKQALANTLAEYPKNYFNKVAEVKKIYNTLVSTHVAHSASTRSIVSSVVKEKCQFQGSSLEKIVLSYLFKQKPSPSLAKFKDQEEKEATKNQRKCVIA